MTTLYIIAIAAIVSVAVHAVLREVPRRRRVRWEMVRPGR